MGVNRNGSLSLLPEVLRGCVALGGTVLLAFCAAARAAGPGDIEVTPLFSRTVFAKDEGRVALRYRVRNLSDGPLSGTAALAAYDLPIMKPLRISLAKGGETVIEGSMPAQSFRSGPVNVSLRLTPDGGAPLTKGVSELRIGPWRNPDRLEIAVWPRVKERVCLKETLDAGITTTSFAVAADLDDITQLGGYGGVHLRTARDYGCPAGPGALAAARTAVDEFLAKFENHPTIRYVVLNTEQWGEICFCDSCRAAYARETGIDVKLLEEYVAKGGERRWKSHVLIPPIPQYLAKNGLVEDDNPLLRFAVWWWERGGDINIHNQAMADALGAKRPDITALTEPVMRFGAVRRYRPPAVAGDWHYPRRPESWLSVLAFLKGMQKSWGTRLVTTVGMMKLAGDFAPYGITNPPDILSIESWLCLAHLPDTITYFLWEATARPDGPFGRNAPLERYEALMKGLTWEKATALAREKSLGNAWVPGAPEAVRRFSEKAAAPYGPLLKRLKPVSARVAVLCSFASAVVGGKPWYLSWNWFPVVQELARGPYEMEVVFDPDLRADRLGRFAAVVLPSAFALRRSGVEALRAYTAAGGLVLAGPSQKENLPGASILPSLDRAADARDAFDAAPVWTLLAARAAPDRSADSDRVLLREARAEGTRVLFAVNNTRENGPLFGHYPNTFEKGVPAAATVGVAKDGRWFCYSLGASREMPLSDAGTQWSFRDEIPAAWGNVYVFYRQRIGGISIEAPAGAACGDEPAVAVTVTDDAGGRLEGAVPISIEITDPAGERSDFSRYACAAGGRYEFRWPIPFLTRRDPAHTGAWTIRAVELASGRSTVRTVSVQGSRKTAEPADPDAPAGEFRPQ